jgi:hypothetical protein
MDPDLIYRKSAKGAEAINARRHGLVGRARSLLILVDGRRGLGELLTLASGFGDVAQMLDELARGGFIEPVPGAGGAPQQLPPAYAPAAPAPPPPSSGIAPLQGPATITFAQTKAFTCHRLIELLGPTADSLCLKVEATRGMADFVPVVQGAYSVVREVRGQAEADRFGAAIEAYLPNT